PEMIEAAEERIGDIAALLVSTVEEIRTTLASQTFSKIVCWGVFDLTQQNIALRNMLEKLDLNGRMLLRGKNDYYHPEDEDAVIAEEKCKEKGISNHFTNYDSLCSLIESLGGKVVEESFFEWRGDGVKDQ